MQLQVSPLTDLSQSTLLGSTRSGSVMVLPGRILLKKAKSSSVTLEKGNLSGAPEGDNLDPSASTCSSRVEATTCPELQVRKGLQLGTGKSMAVDCKSVLWGYRHLRVVFSLSALWKSPAMTEEKGGNTSCRKQVEQNRFQIVFI